MIAVNCVGRFELLLTRLAEWLQLATQHKYAWFGRFWPGLLTVSFAGLLVLSGIVSGIFRSTLIGTFFTSSNFVWQLLLVVGWSSNVLAFLSLLLDESC